MSKSGVLIWLVIALVLGGGALWVLRKPPPSPGALRGPVLAAPMARITELAVKPGGSASQRVTRDAASGEWFLSGGDQGSTWPVQIGNIQTALRMLCTLEGRDAEASAEPPGPGDPEVRLTLDDGTAWTLWLAPRGLGGERLARIQPPEGAPARTVLVEGSLFDALLETGPAAWRIPIAFSDLATEADGITLAAIKGRIVLGRVAGRWALREPVAAPADDASVQALLKNLSAVHIARFLDGPPDPAAAHFDVPVATAMLSSERRAPVGDGFETFMTTRTLTVGGPASIDGKELYARVDRVASRSSGPEPAPSTTFVTIGRESVQAISMDATAYLTAAAVPVPSGEVGSIAISGPGITGGFTRSIDGWGPDAPPGGPGDPERVAALVKLLCEQAPESRTVHPEPLDAPVSITLGSLGGNPLGEVLVGLQPAGGDATPGAESLVIISGEVGRQYDPAPWREVVGWLTTPPAR
jgi:hypothetical protein